MCVITQRVHPQERYALMKSCKIMKYLPYNCELDSCKASCTLTVSYTVNYLFILVLYAICSLICHCFHLTTVIIHDRASLVRQFKEVFFNLAFYCTRICGMDLFAYSFSNLNLKVSPGKWSKLNLSIAHKPNEGKKVYEFTCNICFPIWSVSLHSKRRQADWEPSQFYSCESHKVHKQPSDSSK